jgi:hypothetical protein
LGIFQVRRPINFTSPSVGSSKKAVAHHEKGSMSGHDRPKVPPFPPAHAALMPAHRDTASSSTPLLSALSMQPPWPPRLPLPAPSSDVLGLDVDCESMRWLLEAALMSPASTPYSTWENAFLAPAPQSIFLPLPPAVPAQPLPDAPRERAIFIKRERSPTPLLPDERSPTPLPF